MPKCSTTSEAEGLRPEPSREACTEGCRSVCMSAVWRASSDGQLARPVLASQWDHG